MPKSGKRGEAIALKIIGAATGSTGFIVLALSTNALSTTIGTALVGIGSLLIAAGGQM